MDRRQTFPLSVEEAKHKLREASFGTGPHGWLLRNKWRLVGLAFTGGYFAARLPVAAGASVLRHAAPLLVLALQQWRQERQE